MFMGGVNSVFASDKKQIAARVPDELYTRVIEKASELGVSRGDVTAHALSLLLNMPESDPLRIRSERAKEPVSEDQPEQTLMTG